jgi:D-xylose transport system substrate-binding protein
MKKMLSMAVIALMLIAAFAACTPAAAPAASSAAQQAAESAVAPASSPAASESAAASESPSEGTVDLSKKTIGVSFDWLSVQRRVIARDYLMKYAKEAGVNLIFQDAKADEAVQAQQCENLISQGVDVLVLLPQNAETCGPIVEQAKKANIPVVNIDRLIPNADVDYYVGMNNDKIGDLIAKYPFDLKPKGNYILICGAPTDPNAAIYKEGYMRIIGDAEKAGDIKIVGDVSCNNWDPNIAFSNTENFLTKNNDNVDVILAMNDGMAGGVVQALKARNLNGKVLVTGQDGELAACQRIVAGDQVMSVWKPDNELSRMTIECCVSIMKGEKPQTNATQNNKLKDVPSVYVEPVVIDKNNLKDTIIAAGYFKESEVYQK